MYKHRLQSSSREGGHAQHALSVRVPKWLGITVPGGDPLHRYIPNVAVYLEHAGTWVHSVVRIAALVEGIRTVEQGDQT